MGILRDDGGYGERWGLSLLDDGGCGERWGSSLFLIPVVGFFIYFSTYMYYTVFSRPGSILG